MNKLKTLIKNSVQWLRNMLLYKHIATEDAIMLNLDMNALIDAIQSKWQDNPCPMCGNKTWTISNDIYTLTKLGMDGSILLGTGKLVPLIPVSCNNCSNTVLINPKALGCLNEINVDDNLKEV